MTELLSPAGNYEKYEAAVRYGADAVYLAGSMFGMRASADNFTPEEIDAAVKHAHSLGKKVYLTVNTLPRVGELAVLDEYIDGIRDSGVDAIIVADLGVMAMLRRKMPHTPLHVSTQMSITNPETCNELLRLGASRVVLARELSLADIREIRRLTDSALELEAFIHGSMCVSWSGRCLLSEYMVDRDANRGMCAQPCRWNYKIFEIVEEKRPDMPLPVIAEGGETFIMSSMDMCMIEHIPDLMESGLNCFKIEGRMKSAYYTAVVTNTYRMAMDKYMRDPEKYRIDPEWVRELSGVSHRDYCSGYYYANPRVQPQIYKKGGYICEKAYLAAVDSYDEATKRAFFTQRNKFCEGETVELISPGQTGISFTATDIRDTDGAPITATPHPHMNFSLPVPCPVSTGGILRSGEC